MAGYDDDDDDDDDLGDSYSNNSNNKAFGNLQVQSHRSRGGITIGD